MMRSKIGWDLCLTVVFAIGGALRSGADTYDYRVQYLESSGTQYIDTGIVPTGVVDKVVHVNAGIEPRAQPSAEAAGHKNSENLSWRELAPAPKPQYIIIPLSKKQQGRAERGGAPAREKRGKKSSQAVFAEPESASRDFAVSYSFSFR